MLQVMPKVDEKTTHMNSDISTEKKKSYSDISTLRVSQRQADEKLHIWHMNSWLLYTKTSASTLRTPHMLTYHSANATYERCTRRHAVASRWNNTLINSPHFVISALKTRWLMTKTRTGSKRDWQNAAFVSVAGARLTLEGYTHNQ